MSDLAETGRSARRGAMSGIRQLETFPRGELCANEDARPEDRLIEIFDDECGLRLRLALAAAEGRDRSEQAGTEERKAGWFWDADGGNISLTRQGSHQ